MGRRGRDVGEVRMGSSDKIYARRDQQDLRSRDMEVGEVVKSTKGSADGLARARSRTEGRGVEERDS
jgi:hypothetical protein